MIQTCMTFFPLFNIEGDILKKVLIKVIGVQNNIRLVKV